MSCGSVTLDWRETIDLVWRDPRPRMGRKASGRQTKTHITWHGMLYLKAVGRATTAEQGIMGRAELCRPPSGTRSYVGRLRRANGAFCLGLPQTIPLPLDPSRLNRTPHIRGR
jgi:hypothetical protein